MLTLSTISEGIEDELFALYDTGGYRTADGGDHIKDQEAKKRAEGRKGQSSTAKKKVEKDATVLPTYGQELNRFKGIVRNIANHEMTQDHKKLFKMEDRQRLRRLALIGIKGHQPAIAALCKMSEEEKSRVVQSLMKQKIGAGANSKSNKAIQEFAQRNLEQTNQEEKIKVRIAKTSRGAVVKWKREKKETEEK